MQESFIITKVAVLGAGVMGAQIAAHCVNAGLETLLFDLPSKEPPYNAVVDKAIHHLRTLKPSPLGTAGAVSLLTACNYETDLPKLSDCDLVIEAIGERLDWKEALYQRIAPSLTERSILVTNTSGLSIATLAQALPESQRARFCGIHFFNPPRYMQLAELIPTPDTDSALLDQLESWLTRYLGKGVVRAYDTPNFIANRIGVFSLLTVLHHTDAWQLGLDVVDALTGPLIGRPKSATFRTMDVVGLDTMQHVVRTMQEELPDDPWHAAFHLPDWLTQLIAEGAIGQKAGHGIYRKQGRTIEVYDVAQGGYRALKGEVSKVVQSIMAIPNIPDRMAALFASDDPEAQFLAACWRDVWHYSAYHLEGIADNVRDVDLALRWGFGWKQGPFEYWQLAGLSEMRQEITKGVSNKVTMSEACLPHWLDNCTAFYTSDGAFSPRVNTYQGRSGLPVYQRQYFPERVLAESELKLSTLFENSGVCLQHLQDDVAVLHFKTKANTIDQSVLDGLHEALELVEQRCQGCIIYQKDPANFSSGADLRYVSSIIQSQKTHALETMLSEFQSVLMRLQKMPLPVVAALRGRALGGGCELLLHCDAVVAAFESYPGLVEAGVGLIPAGGGCTVMAKRAAAKAQSGDVMAFIRPYFEQIATAAVASSAPDALRRGYLQERDDWVMHPHEVLFAALTKVKTMQTLNYHPPVYQRFPVAGREGHAILQTGLVNWLEGGFISEHDYYLANQLAWVLCGGDVFEGELVDDAWMQHLERAAFINLALTPLTQERIKHVLETGKPLRN